MPRQTEYNPDCNYIDKLEDPVDRFRAEIICNEAQILLDSIESRRELLNQVAWSMLLLQREFQDLIQNYSLIPLHAGHQIYQSDISAGALVFAFTNNGSLI